METRVKIQRKLNGRSESERAELVKKGWQDHGFVASISAGFDKSKRPVTIITIS